ncbi:hypothetical protein ACOSQ3_022730 [Xanthoceras sorbifolium]
MAAQHGLFVAWCESDAANVVAAVNDVSVSFCKASPVISDIKAFYKVVGVSSCLAIPRSRNGLAHSLASLALSSMEDQLWLGVRPPCSGY